MASNALEVTGIEQAAGEKARDFLRGKILGKQVTIQSLLHPEETQRKIPRISAVVWLDGVNLNDLLAKKGHATEKIRTPSRIDDAI